MLVKRQNISKFNNSIFCLNIRYFREHFLVQHGNSRNQQERENYIKRSSKFVFFTRAGLRHFWDQHKNKSVCLTYATL